MRFIHFAMDSLRKNKTRYNKLIQGTIAYERNGTEVSIGMAFVHPRDQFIKTEGRRVASEILNTQPVKFTLPSLELSGHEINSRILKFLEATYPSIPNFPIRLHNVPVEITLYYRHEVL